MLRSSHFVGLIRFVKLDFNPVRSSIQCSFQQVLARSQAACLDLLAARYSLTDVAVAHPYKVLTYTFSVRRIRLMHTTYYKSRRYIEVCGSKTRHELE
jgi:hypothetical protein